MRGFVFFLTPQALTDWTTDADEPDCFDGFFPERVRAGFACVVRSFSLADLSDVVAVDVLPGCSVRMSAGFSPDEVHVSGFPDA